MSGGGGWRPITELKEPAQDADDFPFLTVRVEETWRWQPYKPEGARQMKRRGRWQKFTGYGFENCDLPEFAEFRDPAAPPEEEVGEPALKPYQP
jgi:hypothetical protein